MVEALRAMKDGAGLQACSEDNGAMEPGGHRPGRQVPFRDLPD
jgi:hypothetical protein